ncbi:MAG: SDR family oxidoreductase [Sphingobacteriaceae bacterium]|nr:SDR family oxidoreductase [Sphingobacteriaceae bacterium]
MSLTGKIAIVSGSASPVGLGIVRSLLQQNATVIAPVKSSDEIALLTQSLGDISSGKLITELTDVQEYEKMADLVDNCIEEFGRIDIAVAGFDPHCTSPCLTDVKPGEWEKIIEGTLNKFFVFAKTILQKMKENKQGLFVSLSNTDHLPQKAYSPLFNIVSKTRLEMAKVFANEVKDWNVEYHHLFVDNAPLKDKQKPGSITPEMAGPYLIELFGQKGKLSNLFKTFLGR